MHVAPRSCSRIVCRAARARVADGLPDTAWLHRHLQVADPERRQRSTSCPIPQTVPVATDGMGDAAFTAAGKRMSTETQKLEQKDRAAQRLVRKADRKTQAAARAAIPGDPDVDPDLAGIVAGPQPRPEEDEVELPAPTPP